MSFADSRETLGPVRFSGHSDLTIDARGSNVTHLRIPSLERGTHGTLTLVGRQQNAFNSIFSTPLSRFEIIDTTLVEGDAFMLHPSVVGIDTSPNVGPLGYFLRPVARPSGLVLEHYPPVAFDESTDHEVAHYGGGSLSSADHTVHAVRILSGFTLPIPTGKSLTIGSGGIIGGSISGSAASGSTLRFEKNGSPVEGFLFINQGAATISVPIIAPAGLTKFGAQTLTLS